MFAKEPRSLEDDYVDSCSSGEENERSFLYEKGYCSGGVCVAALMYFCCNIGLLERIIVVKGLGLSSARNNLLYRAMIGQKYYAKYNQRNRFREKLALVDLVNAQPQLDK